MEINVFFRGHLLELVLHATIKTHSASIDCEENAQNDCSSWMLRWYMWSSKC